LEPLIFFYKFLLLTLISLWAAGYGFLPISYYRCAIEHFCKSDAEVVAENWLHNLILYFLLFYYFYLLFIIFVYIFLLFVYNIPIKKGLNPIFITLYICQPHSRASVNLRSRPICPEWGVVLGHFHIFAIRISLNLAFFHFNTQA
jgi:hypothetical protein